MFDFKITNYWGAAFIVAVGIIILLWFIIEGILELRHMKRKNAHAYLHEDLFNEFVSDDCYMHGGRIYYADKYDNIMAFSDIVSGFPVMQMRDDDMNYLYPEVFDDRMPVCPTGENSGTYEHEEIVPWLRTMGFKIVSVRLPENRDLCSMVYLKKDGHKFCFFVP